MYICSCVFPARYFGLFVVSFISSHLYSSSSSSSSFFMSVCLCVRVMINSFFAFLFNIEESETLDVISDNKID